MKPGKPDRDDAWFEIYKSPGHIQAVPINRKGWLALLGSIVGPVPFCLLAALLFMDNVPMMIGVMLACVFVSLAVIITLVIVKGRPARRSPDL